MASQRGTLAAFRLTLAVAVHLCDCAPALQSTLASESVTATVFQSNVTSLYVSASKCADSGVCSAAGSPCCSLKYAVENVAAFMMPASDIVPINVETGVYSTNSCGVSAQRPLHIQGAGDVTIDCGGSGRVLFSSSSLLMSNLTLAGGFVSDGSDGGAVSIISSNSSSFAFLGVVFRDNAVLHGNGGGLSINISGAAELADVSVLLDDVSFEGNSVSSTGMNRSFGGGGVYLSLRAPFITQVQVIARHCEYKNNQVNPSEGQSGYGGATFIDIEAVVTEGIQIQFTNVSMKSNSITSFGGSIVYGGSLAATIMAFNTSSTDITFTGCTFDGNYILSYEGYGGNVYISISVSSVASVTSVALLNSEVSAGGAVYVLLAAFISVEATLTMAACTISGNSLYSFGYGGAVYYAVDANISSHAVVMLSDCAMSSNFNSNDYEVSGAGNAVYLTVGSFASDTVVTVARCSITGNGVDYADGVGAALSVNIGASRALSSDTVVTLSQCDIWNSKAQSYVTDAGGVAVGVLGSSQHTHISVVQCTFFEILATYSGSALSVTLDRDGSTATNASIVIDSCQFVNNTSYGSGGAVFISNTLDMPADAEFCLYPAEFRKWSFNSTISMSNCVFIGNVAVGEGATGNGGAIVVQPGGNVSIINCTIASNYAYLFGGGVFVGGTTQGVATCSLNVSQSTFVANRNGRAGGQLYFSCGGSLDFSAALFDMLETYSEVHVPQAGNVIWSDSSLFTCAMSTLFSDELGGLYGSYGSFPTTFVGIRSCDYLVSMLQFGCVQCPFPLQARGQGFSNGGPNNVTNPYCFSCPFGASCYGGVVVAQPGYWGVPDENGVPSFALCPSGYCCSSSADCLSMSSCAGSRTGALCGDCLPDFVEAMGSTLCVPVSKCAADKAIFWPLFVFAMFLDAVIQLMFVSRVWNPSPARPDATIKCLLYFFQMTSYVSIDSSLDGVVEVAGSITSFLSLRIPLSGGSKSRGVCVLDSLTAVSKAQLGAAVPLSVAGAMMLILYVSHYWPRSCRPRKMDRAQTEQSWLLAGSDVSVVAAHHVDATSMSYRSRLIAAGVNFGLTVYSAFVAVVVQLLHCVRVPTADGSPSSRLFIQGSVRCELSGWQMGYVVALLLLIVVPFGLVALTRWSKHARVHLTGSLQDDARLGVARALHATYTSTYSSWESVLMFHRLALALLYTFAASFPVIQTSLNALVSVIALLLHVMCQPMRETRAQPFQTVLLTCLVLVSMSKYFESSTLQLASPRSDAPSSTYLAATTLMFGYAVPATSVIVCYHRDMLEACCKLGELCRKRRRADRGCLCERRSCCVECHSCQCQWCATTGSHVDNPDSAGASIDTVQVEMHRSLVS